MTQLDKSKYGEALKKVIPCRVMTPEDFQFFIGSSELLKYEDGELIVKQGAVDQSFYAVVAGSVQVMVEETSGKDVYIATIGAGEVFGEAGIFLKVPRTANVLSLDDSIILRITREAVMKFIRQHPVSGNKFLMVIVHSLLKKLKEANQELAYERQCDVDQGDIDSILKDFGV